MASGSLSVTGSPVTTLKEPGKDLYAKEARMRRSYSDNHLCYSINRIRIRASSETRSKLRASPSSVGIFSFQFSSSLFPNSIRSFLFDPDARRGSNVEENSADSDDETELELEQEKKRANWVERILEIKSRWREKKNGVAYYIQENNEECYAHGAEEDCCEVDYGDETNYSDIEVDKESFRALLKGVSWSDTKLFSKLAFLCNLAYVIPEIKAMDLRRYYGLEFVTSSLVRKLEAAAMKDTLDKDSTRVLLAEITKTNAEEMDSPMQKRVHQPSVAYEIAASAASYVQSRAKDLLSLGSEPQLEISDEALNDKANHQEEVDEEERTSASRVHKSEMAVYVAASTMTAVVAADEKQKQEAARDLQSLHNSPCEWFVCDDLSIYTRCFVIQGSDSLASWQANLFFEPTKFEGTNVLVHRGIYEAAKGIYEQFMPEILQHLARFGDRAKLQFTGHSLGGSLSLLVNLMLLTRKVVRPSALLPVVTFGSPFVFCGGQKILDELGLDENHIHCVMMHRDIVPRAFSCNYPNYVAQVLKRLNSTFRSHPCLNKNKLLYTPMGKIFILQPDEKMSPQHPLLPAGSALYALENTHFATTAASLRAFLNSPHPVETLSDPAAYGSEGTILRDHDSSNYLKAVNEVIRQQTRQLVKKARKQRNLIWPLLTTPSPHAWSHDKNLEDMLATKEIMTGA